MKTSLRKLGRFARHKQVSAATERRHLRPLSQLDEIAQASQDLDDMKDCYESLFAAAAATTNTAYEFSESLRELGSCLLEKTALNDDEESGEVLLMLGKIQFELQKVFDRYRSHISRTITTPSQSLLNELRTVEEMKQQCDEKRNTYESMVVNYQEKGRSRTGKRDNFSVQELQDARVQFDEEATLFVFRLKSLKQGQSRSLLTQAARHHAAQMYLFKKALRSLEKLEPRVKPVAEKHHIDYKFNGLEDDDSHEIEDGYDDAEDDDEDDDHYDGSYVGRDDGELSFDYARNGHVQVNKSTLRHPMELNHMDLTFPNVATTETLKENLEKSPREFVASLQNLKTYTQSAPLFAEKKSSAVTDRMLPIRQSSVRKLQTYVLPTPEDPKNPVSKRPADLLATAPKVSMKMHDQKVWHSSPLEPQKYGKKSANDKHWRALDSNALPVLKESNKTPASNTVPPPLAESLLFKRLDPIVTSSSKKFKRQAYSGPLIKKQEHGQPLPQHPELYSGPILGSPISQLLSSSPNASIISPQPPVSSPKISELHELPRPPASTTGISGRPPGLVGYSAPLVPRGTRDSSAKNENMVAPAGSPLPVPPTIVCRSFSIPTSCPKIIMEVLQNVETSKGVPSSPLTQLSLASTRP
ncbi:hypothetical protein SAY86_018198 [Trapa natans]|uniref:BAR domain-containing protein n=1 Tax=Trapa natans TaxID=22666 RepID=A0AAN7R0T2_TRANT|nr:hypothetical protein SAY86_018198 [Trapa natans]